MPLSADGQHVGCQLTASVWALRLPIVSLVVRQYVAFLELLHISFNVQSAAVILDSIQLLCSPEVILTVLHVLNI